MAYTVFETNVAQSANIAAGQAVAAFITSNGTSEGAGEVYDEVFDRAFAKLKAVFDGDKPAHQAATEAPRGGGGARQAPKDPGEVAFNFGAVKGLKVSEVAGMDEAALKAHGEKLVAEGWTGTPYEKGGQAYLDYVAGSKNPKLSYMNKVVSNFLDSKRA